MSVAVLAMLMLVAYAVLTLGVRIFVSIRQTGTTGLIGLREGASLLEIASGVVFVLGNLLGGFSPFAVERDWIGTLGWADGATGHGIGTILAAAGILIVFAAQMGMGSSWRIGVAEDQATDLITGGFFAVTRNPIYTGMFVTWTGFFLMVPTVVAIVGFVLVTLGLEGQVRLVEEPYMRRAHPSYADYERRVGRFFPGIGRSA